MAWEAYCNGTIPIGAVVADAEGNILSRGRNRILDASAPDGQIYNDMLAHVETEVTYRGEIIITSRFFDEWRAMSPEAMELGLALYRSGELRKRQKEGLTAKDAINWLVHQVQ